MRAGEPLTLALVAASLLGLGCAPRESATTTLSFWALGREGELVLDLLPDFERAHPGIRVAVQQLPWTAAHEKLLTAFAGDATPDLANLGNTWMPEFAALAALAPLDERVAASTALAEQDFFPGIWDTNVIDGTLYGVPWYVDTRLLFYRRDLLAKAGYDHPPGTWDEWRAMMVAVKRLMGPTNYAALLPINEYEPLLVLALQQEDELLRDGGRYGNFESPGFLRALGFYASLFAGELAPRATNTQISNVWQEFGRGFFSFYISGPWMIGEFKRRLPPELQGSWMTAPMPGPRGPGSSIAGGTTLAIFRASKHQDEAFALIEYLCRPEIQVRFHELSGNLPAEKSAWSSPALAGQETVRAFRAQLERARAAPKVPEWERIANRLRDVGEAVVNGRWTVEQGAHLLNRDVDAMLEKRRFLLSRRGPR